MEYSFYDASLHKLINLDAKIMVFEAFVDVSHLTSFAWASSTSTIMNRPSVIHQVHAQKQSKDGQVKGNLRASLESFRAGLERAFLIGCAFVVVM